MSASRRSGGVAAVDASALQPLLKPHGVNAEVLRDLLDRDAGLTILRDAHDIVAELLRIGRVGMVASFQEHLPGTPSQMSPTRSANPPMGQDKLSVQHALDVTVVT